MKKLQVDKKDIWDLDLTPLILLVGGRGGLRRGERATLFDKNSYEPLI